MSMMGEIAFEELERAWQAKGFDKTALAMAKNHLELLKEENQPVMTPDVSMNSSTTTTTTITASSLQSPSPQAQLVLSPEEEKALFSYAKKRLGSELAMAPSAFW